MHDDDKPKHKPQKKHTLSEVLKSLQDLIRTDLVTAQTAAAEPPKPVGPPPSPAEPDSFNDALSTLDEMITHKIIEPVERARQTPPEPLLPDEMLEIEWDETPAALKKEKLAVEVIEAPPPPSEPSVDEPPAVETQPPEAAPATEEITLETDTIEIAIEAPAAETPTADSETIELAEPPRDAPTEPESRTTEPEPARMNNVVELQVIEMKSAEVADTVPSTVAVASEQTATTSVTTTREKERLPSIETKKTNDEPSTLGNQGAFDFTDPNRGQPHPIEPVAESKPEPVHQSVAEEPPPPEEIPVLEVEEPTPPAMTSDAESLATAPSEELAELPTLTVQLEDAPAAQIDEPASDGLLSDPVKTVTLDTTPELSRETVIEWEPQSFTPPKKATAEPPTTPETKKTEEPAKAEKKPRDPPSTSSRTDGPAPSSSQPPGPTGESKKPSASRPAKPQNPAAPVQEEIPVLKEVAELNAAAVAELPSPAQARDIAIRVIAKLNIERRKAGETPLDIKTIEKLQQYLTDALAKRAMNKTK